MPQHPSPGRPKPWRESNTAVYHITDVENLQSLVAKGDLLCEDQCLRDGISPVCIAYQNLKSTRSRIEITAGDAEGKLSDYVPFYYAPRSPMLFVNYIGGVEGYDKGQDEIVHLVCCAEELAATAPFVIIDGHGVSPLSNQTADLGSLAALDWDVMNAHYWSDTDEDGDRKRRRQAEFLVYERVPMSMVKLVGARSEDVAKRARSALRGLSDPPPVAVRPDWYY
jgi:hypothetical protein